MFQIIENIAPNKLPTGLSTSPKELNCTLLRILGGGNSSKAWSNRKNIWYEFSIARLLVPASAYLLLDLNIYDNNDNCLLLTKQTPTWVRRKHGDINSKKHKNTNPHLKSNSNASFSPPLRITSTLGFRGCLGLQLWNNMCSWDAFFHFV